MAAVTIYNAFNLPRVASPKASRTVLPNVPKQKPFASQRSLQSLAFNPALDSAAFQGPSPLPFVRPDVPPESDETAQGGRGGSVEATAEASFKARPQFRSALEQVSYVTNNKLFDARKQAKSQRQVQRSLFSMLGL